MKKLTQKILTYLPNFMQEYIVRGTLCFDFKLPEGLVFKVAKSDCEIKQSFRLVQKSYIKNKLIDDSNEEYRITKYHQLPTTTIIVAKLGEIVVGTVTVILDSSAGLPIDEFKDVSSLRKRSLRICEFSSLAVDRSSKKVTSLVFMHLIRFALKYVEEVLKADAIVCVLTNYGALLYKILFGFKQVNAKKNTAYNFVKLKNIDAIYLETGNSFDNFLATTYGDKKSKQNLNKFKHFDFSKNEIIENFEYNKSVHSYLGNGNNQSFIFNSIDNEFYNKMRLFNDQDIPPRFPVICQAKMNVTLKDELSFRVSNVSQGGMCVESLPNEILSSLEVEQELILKIKIKENLFCRVRGVIVYKNNYQTKCGIKITSVDKEIWNGYINFLTQEYIGEQHMTEEMEVIQIAI